MLPLLASIHRFPHPDWTATEQQLEPREHSCEELDRFWTDRAREWVHLLRDALGAGYRGYESGNFWLICREPEATCRRLISGRRSAPEAARFFVFPRRGFLRR